ncbi:MAG: helix-turn-helix transcriptional regulator [Clostridia bacterium]|nr:helix-turn-helix transcriptional regulator [Clostridia bacterium]
MYNLNVNSFTENLNFYRKKRNLTLEELGIKIHKTKATLSKYEKGEIIPDIITILELCNCLNISFSQLIPEESTSSFNQTQKSFNILYLYYYSNNMFFQSVLEFSKDHNRNLVKFYNGVKDISNYKKEHSYYYEGVFEKSLNICYIDLSNSINNTFPLEKVQITFNISWSSNNSRSICFISGLTPNLLPLIKKGIISKTPIDDNELLKKFLIIDKTELNKIKNNNSWILENKDYDQFFYL